MPLNNRATVGGYEPGSTFKGIVSLAGFRSGYLHPLDHMPKACIGGYHFGNRFWRCWDPRGHGSINFYEAFTQSCDAYYYQVGLAIGMNPINEVASEFGFGHKTGIDLDEERSGELVDLD
jgi:penicillin-binding protein 2